MIFKIKVIFLNLFVYIKESIDCKNIDNVLNIICNGVFEIGFFCIEKWCILILRISVNML